MNALVIKRKGTVIWIVLASFVGILILVGAGLIAGSFIRYRSNGGIQIDTEQSKVIISHPENMAQLQAGFPIEVDVNAVSQQPITSIELWINGQLEGVQAGPASGLNEFASSFTWIPPSAGNFALVARAITSSQGTDVSPAVFIFINQPESGDQVDPEAGKIYPLVYPAAPDATTFPSQPAEGDQVTPADAWQGSLNEWVTDLIADSLPKAPELTANAAGCDIKISIHDLSDNEEGFKLFRMTSNNPEWAEIKILASHAGPGWIETLDSNLSGGITYYAVAFNSRGESSSNLVMVNTDPQTCAVQQPSTNLEILALRVTGLEMDGNMNHFYCYSRLGEMDWSRWPDVGFLTSEMHDLPPVVKPFLLSSLGNSGAVDGLKSLDLTFECWAWEGIDLRQVGSFFGKIDLVDPKPLQITFPALKIEISDYVQPYLKRESFTLGSGLPPLADIDDIYNIDNLGYIPESDQMPLIYAYVTYDRSVCEKHVNDTLFKEAECFPMPGFNSGPGGTNPQPYLVWIMFNNSCKGWRTKECFNLEWWQGFTNSYPDPYNPGVHYDVISYGLFSHENWGDAAYESQELYSQAYRILPNQPAAAAELCPDAYRFFYVALTANTSLGEIANYSNLVPVQCPVELGDTVNIEVLFHSMDLQNIDDGWDSDNATSDNTADNVYGQFTARVNGQPGSTLRAGWWNGKEPTDYGGANGWIPHLDNGWYDLTGFQFCLQGPGNCDTLEETPFMHNNNRMVVTVHDGDALLLFTELYDYDELSADDAICNTNAWVGPRTLEEWAATTNEGYNLIQPEGDATCNVLAILNAIK